MAARSTRHLTSRTARRLLGVTGLLLVIVTWRGDQAARTAYGTGWIVPEDAGRQLATGACEGCLRLPSEIWVGVHAAAGFFGPLLVLAMVLLWGARLLGGGSTSTALKAFLLAGAGVNLLLACAGVATRAAGDLGHGTSLIAVAVATDFARFGVAALMGLAVANVSRASDGGGGSLLATIRSFLQRQRVNLIGVVGLALALTLVPQTSGQAIDSVRTWGLFTGGAHGWARFTFGLATSLLLALVVYESGLRLARAKLTWATNPSVAPAWLLFALGTVLGALGVVAVTVAHGGYGLIVAAVLAFGLGILELPRLPERRSEPESDRAGRAAARPDGYAPEYLAIVPLLAIASVSIAAAVDAALSRGVTLATLEVLLPGIVLAAVAVVMTVEREPHSLDVPRVRAWLLTPLVGIAAAVLLLGVGGARTETAAAVFGTLTLAGAVGYAWIRFRTRASGRLWTSALSLPLAFAAGLAVAFAVHFDVHTVGETIGTFALVNLALAFILTVLHFAVLASFSLRPPRLLCWFGLDQLPIVSLFAVWWVGAGIVLPPPTLHEVRLVQRDPGAVGKGPTLKAAFVQWVAAQPELTGEAGADRSPVPLLLVASHGGGIRAAYWTAIALDCIVGVDPRDFDPRDLQSPTTAAATREATCRDRRRSTTQQQLAARRIFIGSAVSGGAVGLYAYARELLARSELSPSWFDGRLDRDFASAMIGWGLFHDVTNHFLGLNAHRGGACGWKLGSLCLTRDRAAILEESLDRAWKGEPPLLRQTWERRLAGDPALRGPAETVPLLLTNATVTGGNARAVISAGDLGSWPNFETDALDQEGKTLDPYPLAGTVEATEALCLSRDIRLSTAALLGSRFPYVSPSGHLSGRCGQPEEGQVRGVDGDSLCGKVAASVCELRLVDGGYADNSGLFTIAALWPSLRQLVIEFNRTAPRKLAPVIVELDNHYRVSRQSPVSGRGSSAESLIPLTTAFGARTSIETYARALAYRLRPRTCTVTVTPALHPGLTAPLGWELSSDAREDLRDGLVRAQDLPERLSPAALDALGRDSRQALEYGRDWRAFQLRRLQAWLGSSDEPDPASLREGLFACVPE